MKTFMHWRRRREVGVAALILCVLLPGFAGAADDAPAGKVSQRLSIVADHITSFFVRDAETRRIVLSVLVAHNFELTQFVRKLTGEAVTPLVFSVSILPGRHGFFDPYLLSFEQNGKIWKPSPEELHDFMPLTADTPFGGDISEGEVHQGVVFVPAWFDPEAPITVQYGHYRSLTRFIDR